MGDRRGRRREIGDHRPARAQDAHEDVLQEHGLEGCLRVAENPLAASGNAKGQLTNLEKTALIHN